ncbi:tryptophan dimethylallyltransferase family protein [Streptomyces sp. NBC_00239]|uniref:tryptophan dimethylallyltransferase family protein n=1 Tax=Streptomyces sp. NBC_00239 TaxID=2903640 RepID=UPI002E299C54|nr:tryptophan dimethylallyltransferase family protein [Streptomyces sp. NBC_00239]
MGGHTSRQVLRLCEAAGLGGADSADYARTLLAALGPAAERPLALPPSADCFLSDDHTPVEFSLSFVPGAAPTLRVLLEPGFGADGLAANGRSGLRAVRAMARRWGFGTRRLDELEDLFFPPAPEGPLALWCALELLPGGVPKVKVYLNPAAAGQERSADTVREALHRLGHRQAFAALPEGDRHLFFALDLGAWEKPRAKVYLTHRNLSATAAAGLSRMDGGPTRSEVERFFRTAAGHGTAAGTGGRDSPAGTGPSLHRRPGITCHAFTETGSARPSGFTLHIPVRDYARHDGEALDRAVAVLRRHGMDPAPLVRALSAVTARRPEDGVGLIAYLALVHQQGRPPRITAYVSSEAYAVRPPAAEVRVPAGAAL